MVILLLPEAIFAQQKELLTIESVIVDENEKPVADAKIFSNSAYAKTDAEGRFTISTERESNLLIEAEGFEDITITVENALKMARINIKSTEFLYGRNKKIKLAFKETFQGDIVGAVSTVKSEEIMKYDYTIMASEILNGRTPGMLGSNSIRGIGIGINVADITGTGLESGNALFIVDGLPRDIRSLRLSEIESITVLKDVNSAILYGNAAINGVILITTKRGEAYKSVSNFMVNYGIDKPRALPEFLNSADYMMYYNQARINDGQAPTFSPEMIENYKTGNKYRYPDVDYYSSEYMKNFKSYFDINSEFSGGNEQAKYYANIGWYSAGSILDFGEAANARNNIFNVRGNVDLRITDWIKTSLDATSLFGNNKSQRGNFWDAAFNTRPYEFAPLLPINLIDPENSLLLSRKNDIDGKFILGGTSTFQTNPIADSYSGGRFERISRKFSFNNRVDFDLKRIARGLSFHTNISFDYYTAYSQTIDNTYSVYTPSWHGSTDNIINLTQHGRDSRPGIQVVGEAAFQRRLGFYGLASYDRTYGEVHHVTGSLLGYGSTFKEQGDFQGIKHSHLGFQLTYSYQRKYMLDFSSAYMHSVKLAKGNRGGFSPSLGIAWMISNEDFMKSLNNVNFLKLRLSGGILHSDLPIASFFYYDNRFATSGSYAWYEGTRSRSGVMSSWSDNPDLGYAKRNEINLGLEGLFFDKLIGAEINVFYDLYNDQVVRPTSVYPGFYTDFIPFENFNADKYQGMECGLSLNKSIGDWSIFLGANLLYVTSERTKVDEIYDNEYQYRAGKPRDATFGLEAIGLFQSQADIDNSPIQVFGTVKPGDIKYKDQNGDGIIDGNDEVYIRRYQAPLSGGLQFKLSYKILTLYFLGEGRSGAKGFREGDYYWIDGNKKYSGVVLGAWTEAKAASATYPRLSAGTNSNNNRRSTYWLYKDDYFNIRKIQLTCTMPEAVSRSLMMKDLNVFIDASNIWQFAENLKIRDLRVGNEPYYRTFSIGLRANF